MVVIDNAQVLSIKIPNTKIKSYKINIEDAKKVAQVFEKEKPDIVFHLAGPINLRKSVANPLFLRDVNFLSRTQIILDACRIHNVKKIIFISSGGAIYENSKAIPTKEDYLASPNSLYGLANIMIEKYIALYSKNNALHFTIVRLANVYGPRQWKSGFIPATIIKMLKKESPIIYGTGDQTRDFIYIDDVVDALIVLAKKGKNEIYNVGSGKEISLNEVFIQVKKLLGTNIKPIYKSVTVLETERSAVDIKKIQKVFGWKPKTGIKEGLLKTIAWYKKNG